MVISNLTYDMFATGRKDLPIHHLRGVAVRKLVSIAIGVGMTAAASVAGVVATASAVNADTCRESLWGEDIWGNKRFDCSDGSYTLKKPFGTNTWDDPWARYEFKKNNSFRGDGWSGNCKYKSFSNSYRCRGTSSGFSG